ncbi:hypothetical protein QA601_03125 [Chitinispirillales bacterium ANBcel5]|uniref:hypothetical protein n=1 Tax=Cellulosispirillum alkaliphilum TaxID=3039283 RepID=UPI002A50A00E|nr:hypothetical protein [Chitinispirillales bacterium ANBcel5]
MAAFLIGLILVLILVIIAIRVGVEKEEAEETPIDSQIHVSGIYSVFRRDPREQLEKIRPSEEEIRKYLSAKNEDIGKLPLSDSDREEIIVAWNSYIDKNVLAIEKGDSQGVEFYYYDFPYECPGCKDFLSRGHYVSREEIYKHPHIIPPFHLGCVCMIIPHSGTENLRETTETGLRPFFDKGQIPQLPEWTCIVKSPDKQRYAIDESGK